MKTCCFVLATDLLHDKSCAHLEACSRTLRHALAETPTKRPLVFYAVEDEPPPGKAPRVQLSGLWRPFTQKLPGLDFLWCAQRYTSGGSIVLASELRTLLAPARRWEWLVEPVDLIAVVAARRVLDGLGRQIDLSWREEFEPSFPLLKSGIFTRSREPTTVHIVDLTFPRLPQNFPACSATSTTCSSLIHANDCTIEFHLFLKDGRWCLRPYAQRKRATAAFLAAIPLHLEVPLAVVKSQNARADAFCSHFVGYEPQGSLCADLQAQRSIKILVANFGDCLARQNIFLSEIWLAGAARSCHLFAAAQHLRFVPDCSHAK